MDCAFATNAMDHDIVICKLVTGELVIGKVNLVTETIKDVGLIIPRDVKSEESSETKFAFYVVPYGFPMAQRITGESLNLAGVIKIFAPLGGFEDVVSTYIQITAKEVEQATVAPEEKIDG